jgi:hypothetical protein
MALEKTSCDFETYSDEQMPLEHTGNRGTPCFFPGAVIFTISATFGFRVQFFFAAYIFVHGNRYACP